MDCVDRMQPICSMDVVSFCSNMDIHKDACTGLIVLNLLRITPVCVMGVCSFIQPPPKNVGFLLRHHPQPAGLSKPSVSTLHSAGVTVAFEMGAGTQTLTLTLVLTLTLTLAQLALSPVEPCQPPSPQITVRPSVGWVCCWRNWAPGSG